MIKPVLTNFLAGHFRLASAKRSARVGVCILKPKLQLARHVHVIVRLELQKPATQGLRINGSLTSRLKLSVGGRYDLFLV